MLDNSKTKVRALVVIVIVGLALPFSVKLMEQAVEWYIEASYEPAAIVVDNRHAEVMHKFWVGVSQGYEGPFMRLDDTVSKLNLLDLEYVRIDHVFDGYELVEGIDEEGKLKLNYSNLDLLVGDILAMGAKPYFSLSYVPTALSDGDVVDRPRDWDQWYSLVKSFVSHYSRDYGGGIDQVVYEVWNEPDLFGKWRTYGDKNYLTMYETTARAADSVKNAKRFWIGGPATTGLYPAWLKDYYEKTTERKDFYSWHRYSKEVNDYRKDVEDIENYLEKNSLSDQLIMLTEWGIESEKSSLYDGNTSAAHLVAVVRALADSQIDIVMPFQIRDDAVSSQTYHGGWGLLTNASYGAILKKPRLIAYEMLAELEGDRVPLVGEGTYVTAMAMRDAQGLLRIIAVNYDYKGEHDEIFPISVAGLSSGKYEVSERYLSGRKQKTEVNVSEGNLKREIVLNANDVVLMTVKGL